MQIDEVFGKKEPELLAKSFYEISCIFKVNGKPVIFLKSVVRL